MSVTDELLKNNAAYAESFQKGDLPLPPARGVAVMACMDARLDVHKILGLQEGDATSSATLEGSLQTMRSVRLRSPSDFWAPLRSSSSTTPTAGCSPSQTTSSKLRSMKMLA